MKFTERDELNKSVGDALSSVDDKVGWVSLVMLTEEVAFQVFGYDKPIIVMPDPTGEFQERIGRKGKSGVYVQVDSLVVDGFSMGFVIPYDMEAIYGMRNAMISIANRFIDAEELELAKRKPNLFVPEKKLLVPGM